MPRKNIKNQANQNFYMLHKVLFINEKYKKLSDSAKVTYEFLMIELVYLLKIIG